MLCKRYFHKEGINMKIFSIFKKNPDTTKVSGSLVERKYSEIAFNPGKKNDSKTVQEVPQTSNLKKTNSLYGVSPLQVIIEDQEKKAEDKIREDFSKKRQIFIEKIGEEIAFRDREISAMHATHLAATFAQKFLSWQIDELKKFYLGTLYLNGCHFRVISKEVFEKAKKREEYKHNYIYLADELKFYHNDGNQWHEIELSEDLLLEKIPVANFRVMSKQRYEKIKDQEEYRHDYVFVAETKTLYYNNAIITLDNVEDFQKKLAGKILLDKRSTFSSWEENLKKLEEGKTIIHLTAKDFEQIVTVNGGQRLIEKISIGELKKIILERNEFAKKYNEEIAKQENIEAAAIFEKYKEERVATYVNAKFDFTQIADIYGPMVKQYIATFKIDYEGFRDVAMLGAKEGIPADNELKIESIYLKQNNERITACWISCDEVKITIITDDEECKQILTLFKNTKNNSIQKSMTKEFAEIALLCGYVHDDYLCNDAFVRNLKGLTALQENDAEFKDAKSETEWRKVDQEDLFRDELEQLNAKELKELDKTNLEILKNSELWDKKNEKILGERFLRACGCGYNETLQFLVGKKPGLLRYVDCFGASWIHFAITKKQMATFKFLKEKMMDFNVNVKTTMDVTPVYLAVKKFHEDVEYYKVVKYLIEDCKADLNIADKTKICPLQIAINSIPTEKYTTTQQALLEQHTEMQQELVEFLLEKEANPFLEGEDDLTVIGRAVFEGKYQWLYLFGKYGASVPKAELVQIKEKVSTEKFVEITNALIKSHENKVIAIERAQAEMVKEKGNRRKSGAKFKFSPLGDAIVGNRSSEEKNKNLIAESIEQGKFLSQEEWWNNVLTYARDFEDPKIPERLKSMYTDAIKMIVAVRDAKKEIIDSNETAITRGYKK